jgi:uncharacterized protein (TIGR03437 family)
MIPERCGSNHWVAATHGDKSESPVTPQRLFGISVSKTGAPLPTLRRKSSIIVCDPMPRLSHRLTIAFIASALSIAWPAEPPHGEVVRGTRAQSSFAFRAAGVYWRDPSTTTVRARASADGWNWTPWTNSHGERIDGDRIGSGLIYFGEGYKYIEVDGAADPEILLIDPGSNSTGNTEKGADPSAPPIVTREQWGCTPQTCPAKDPPLYTTVTHLIVHHTDNVNTAADWAAVVRAIWVLHVQGNGWNDIGYNYLIDPNGLLYEGRAGGDGVLGAHFSGVNSGTMGVALLGTYIDVTPPAPMLDTLENMLAWQANKWKLDPSGEALHAASGLMLNVISGHRDAGISPKATGTTECPGNTAYSLLPRVRADVLSRTAACVVSVSERNRCVQSGGGSLSYSILSAASNCTGPVSITPAADWVTLSDIPFSNELSVMPNPGPRRSTTVGIGGLNITITQSGKDEAALPCIAARGIVNGANFDSRPVVAGSQVSIFGENFGNAAKAAINGKPAAIEYAGPTQINLNLPANVNIGTNHLTVTANATTGPEVNFWVTEAMPAIFATADGRAIAVNVDENNLNSADAPVKAGRPLTVYLTGVGAVANTPLHYAAFPWTATVGGEAAGKLFLGLAPLFVGVYQSNVVIPADLLTGDYPLAFIVNGVTSREATISVGN